MNIALCIGCLVAVTVLAEATDTPDRQIALEGQTEGYNITGNELDTDDEGSMELRKRKKHCLPTPYCSANGYCVRKREDCNNGTVKARECCGSRKCYCCVPECSAPWRKIPGSGRCYIFSGEVREPRLDWRAARRYCQSKGGDLASAGFLPATEADPLLAYVQDNGLGSTAAGAYWTGSQWMWVDGRTLDVKSNMWLPLQPSGGEDCVEILQESGRPYNTAYLNDIPCSGAARAFVCESK